MVLGTGDYLLDSPLTTFKNHVYEMGGCAAELLIHKLQPMRAAAAEVERVFLPELVVRET